MSGEVSVRVPGSIGNVGPGLDILGLALDGAWDVVRMRWSDRPGITITDPGHPDLPVDPALNTAAIAAGRLLSSRGIDRGISMAIGKGLPVSGGQGGSAASAVGGAVAAAALSGLDCTAHELLGAALAAESTVSGRHLDNLAPSLLGGLVLCLSTDPIDFVRIDPPRKMWITLVTPDQRLRTSEARRVLPAAVPRDTALGQAASIAGMVAGAFLGDLHLFTRSIVDRIAEPARAPLIPGFAHAKEAAMEAGALACSISGAGPTAFALAGDEELALTVGAAMTAAYRREGIAASMRTTTVNDRGAEIP